MALLPINLFFFISTLLLAFSLAATTATDDATSNLAGRLQADGMAQCWDSLMQLRSCSGEVILFFLNGETYLGPSCCRAIRVIEHKCWAADAMLNALGFTAQEGDILRGYCDAASASSPPDSFAAPPPPSLPKPPAARAALKGIIGLVGN